MNQKLLSIALSQYGVTEKSGTTHNPIVLNYFHKIGHQWVTTDETAWCSAFMNWVALKANAQKSEKLNAKSWLKIGISTDSPQAGDVVIFWREKKNSWKGHVGLYINHSEDGKSIYCLGGNQNNQVNIKTYPTYRLLGFRRLQSINF